MRRLFKLFLFPVVFTLISIGHATTTNSLKPYSKTAFNTAMEQGKAILLHFHADWCGVCHMQMKILNTLLKSGKYDNVIALQADYDSRTRSDEESQLVQQLKVGNRSTILYFINGKRVYEISNVKNVGELIDETAIKNALDKLTNTTTKTKS